MKHAESMICLDSDIINLDIGGTHKITTTKKTLCKKETSGLAAMFSNPDKYLPKHNGNFFVDRDGDIFVKVIEYLRNNKTPYFPNNESEILFKEELEFWGINQDNKGNKNLVKYSFS